MKVNNYALVFLTFIVLGVMFYLGVDKSLDARFYYDYIEASAYMSQLSVELSYKYLIKEFFDLGLICLYSALFKRGVRHFLFSSFPLLFISLIPGFFDLIETISVILILKQIVSYDVLNYLGLVTLLKWSSGTILFGLILVSWFKQKVRPSS